MTQIVLLEKSSRYGPYRMDEYPDMAPDPENWNFGKIFRWVLQDLPIRVNGDGDVGDQHILSPTSVTKSKIKLSSMIPV